MIIGEALGERLSMSAFLNTLTPFLIEMLGVR